MRRLFLLMIAALLWLNSCTGRKAQDLSDVKCVEDFRGHSVAVPMGSSYDLMLSEIEGIEVVRLGLGELLVAVEKGRADFCISDQHLVKMLDLESRGLTALFDNILTGTAAAGFRKQDSVLCSQFNSHLNDMMASGVYERWKE